MRFERMIAIIMLLLRREKVSGKELAEMFEVSLRTIYRDIEAINASGIPIVSISGVGGGIGIMDQYKVDRGLFTVNDISAMLTGLGFIQSTLSGKEISNALVKLKSFVSDDQIREINEKTNQVLYDSSPWIGGEVPNDLLNTLKSALDKKQVIAFSYYSRRGTERIQGMEPHRLVLKGNQWYVQGYLPRNQEYRLFKLRRIFNIMIESDIFTARVLPHPFADFSNEMFNKSFPIKLQIDSSVLDRILDYCTVNDVIDIGNGKYTVSFNFIDDDQGYGILMSFGSSLTCLEPPNVRAELIKRLSAAVIQYADE